MMLLQKCFIIFYIVGFMVVSILPHLFSISEGSFTVIFRAIMLILAIAILSKSVLNKGISLLNYKYCLFFILFWMLYSIKIFNDIFLSINFRIDNAKTYSYYISYAYGVIFIPALAFISIDYKKMPFLLIAKCIYYILFISLIISIFYKKSSGIEGRNIDGIEIGVLMLGQYGTSLCLLSLFFLLKRNFSHQNLIYLLGFVIGFVTIFVSASRSPLLGLIICILLFIYRQNGLTKTLGFILILGVCIYYSFMNIILFLEQEFHSSFYERILLTLSHGNNDRIVLYRSAIQEFLDSPLFGNSILIQNKYPGSYPHNLILESFMATGIVGGIIFILFLFSCLKNAWNLMKKKSDIAWIGLLFYQYFIFAMFSGAIFNSSLFWIFGLLSIIINIMNKDVMVLQKL